MSRMMTSGRRVPTPALVRIRGRRYISSLLDRPTDSRPAVAASAFANPLDCRLVRALCRSSRSSAASEGNHAAIWRVSSNVNATGSPDANRGRSKSMRTIVGRRAAGRARSLFMNRDSSADLPTPPMPLTASIGACATGSPDFARRRTMKQRSASSSCSRPWNLSTRTFRLSLIASRASSPWTSAGLGAFGKMPSVHSATRSSAARSSTARACAFTRSPRSTRRSSRESASPAKASVPLSSCLSVSRSSASSDNTARRGSRRRHHS